MQDCSFGHNIKLDGYPLVNISNILLHLILSCYSILSGAQTEAFLESDTLGVSLQETLNLSHFLLLYTPFPTALP